MSSPFTGDNNEHETLERQPSTNRDTALLYIDFGLTTAIADLAAPPPVSASDPGLEGDFR